MEERQNEYCTLVTELLPLYQEHGIGEDTAKIIKMHLKQCPSCRANNEQFASECGQMEKSPRIYQGETSRGESQERGKYGALSKRLRKRKVRNGAIGILVVICLFVLYQTCFLTTIMYGTSMEPTIHSGKTCMISRMAYLAKAPDRGDIVHAMITISGNRQYDIYRIAGVPGDKIQIAGGHLTVNGKQIERYEGICTYESNEGGSREYSITVPDNQYFLLGDNYADSYDSRDPEFGCVDRQDIVGKYICTLKLPNFGTTGTVASERS